MPFLPSSGPLSINDIRNLFGGPGSPSLANYYRGGAYVPSTKSSTTVEGPFFVFNTARNDYWYSTGGGFNAQWNGTRYAVGVGSTSFSAGGWTYYRTTFQFTDYGVGYYSIRREQGSTVSINGGVPTSGTISISNLYGAEKP